jgi:hypothetical protein
MSKYFLTFILLVSITISNIFFFGFKGTHEQQPVLVQKQVQNPTIEHAAPVKLRVWKEAEYHKSNNTDSEKPNNKKSTKPSMVSKGIKYVKIPFNGKYIYVSSDYYTENGVRKPLSLKQAQQIARQYGAVLPTKEMVDAIWKYADLKLEPLPLKAGPLMTKPVYYIKHNELIEKQINKRSYDLVAGNKKDIIRPQREGRVTLYGWHKLNGVPIQPTTNVHDDNYVDYSNCLRLVKLQS